MTQTSPGYRQALSQPVAIRLLIGKGLSELGDFAVLAALLLLAYHRTGSVLGAAAVYAARAVPALLVATLFSGWLDVPARRVALTGVTLTGAALIGVAALWPRVIVAIVVAGLLGAVRAAFRSIHMAVVAESIEGAVRLPFISLSVFGNQAAQVIGILFGASAALTLGYRNALLAGVACYLVTAGVLSTLPRAPKRERGRRPPPILGLHIIWSDPTMRMVAILTWASMLSGGLPETLAPDLVAGDWVPFVMAASSFGGAVFALAVGRTAFLRDEHNQLKVALWLGGCLALGALAVHAGSPPVVLALVNAGVGAGGGWLIGAQATFAQLAPPGRMGQVEASIVAANIIVGGAGIALLGWLADTVGPAAAYLGGAAPVIVTVAAFWQAAARSRTTT